MPRPDELPDDTPITLAEVEAARARIQDALMRTPLVPSPALSDVLGVPVHLKLEHRQNTGSFKLRGATNAVLSLSPEERARGVVGVSTGNHGRGLAQAAKAAGVRCIICMSALVPANKVAGIEALGAEVRIVGRSQDHAQLEVDRLVADGMVMLPPFDDRRVIAGQGTLGLEIFEDLPDIERLIVPVSGGGLAAGVALAIKSLKPGVKVIGVTMERGAAMHASLAAGRPVQVEELPSLADALGGGIGLDNRFTYAMVGALLEEVILVSEAEIARAIRHAYKVEGEVIEGSGAVGIAAILAGRVTGPGTTAVVVSGCNIDPALHARIIAGEDVDLMAERN